MLCTTPWVITEFLLAAQASADECDPDQDDSKPYDHEADGLEPCNDCKGSGWYVGLIDRRYCPTCDGAGYVEIGSQD